MDAAMSQNEAPLRGKSALVTGAGGGVGRGLALALAAAGARVTIAARRAATGDETAALIRAEGGEALSVECDVAQANAVEHAVERAVAGFGGLDILIHNAASGLSGMAAALEAITEEAWDEQVGVAVGGLFHCARSGLPHLARSGRGRFIAFGSAYGLHAAGMNPAYAAMKAATRGFAKALTREWGPRGIGVFVIAPSSASEGSEAFFSQFPEVKKQYLANFAFGRMGDPRRDIGETVVALCSSRFDYLTGQTLVVDGGLYTAL
jgi:NAD(P)-dependent dehydrogenase (short-subunit alcohol dehydrogenase family)